MAELSQTIIINKMKNLCDLLLEITKATTSDGLIEKVLSQFKWIVDFDQCQFIYFDQKTEQYTFQGISYGANDPFPSFSIKTSNELETALKKLYKNRTSAESKELKILIDPMGIKTAERVELYTVKDSTTTKQKSSLVFLNCSEHPFNKDDKTLMSLFATLLLANVTSLNALKENIELVNEQKEMLSKAHISLEQKTEELSQAHDYISDIINSMPSILIGTDALGRITKWNSEAEKVTGHNAAEVHGKDLVKVMPQISDDIQEVLTAIEKRTEYINPSIVFPSEDSTVSYKELTVFPLVHSTEHGAVIRIDDITERINIQNVMVQSEKMTSLAGMAAGIAHEINNPLSIISQSVQNCQRRLNPENAQNIEKALNYGIDLIKLHDFLVERKIISFLDMTLDAVGRSADIVKNMLTFSRTSDSQLMPTNLPELIEHTIKLGASEYDMQKKYDFKFVKIFKEYDSDLPHIMCCRSEIEQVLLNLFKNALQAMEEISLADYKPIFKLRLIKEQAYLRLEIEDNGPGMNEDIQKHIFDPFFTTKEAGVGTGLGLSVSHSIITQKHSGTFTVESTPAGESTDGIATHGMTKFIIRLPLFAKEQHRKSVVAQK